MRNGTDYCIQLTDGGPAWTVDGGSILDGALKAGVDLPHDCTLGGCGTCRVRLLQGSVSYPDDELPLGLTEEEVSLGYALACQARPTSDLLIDARRQAGSPPTQRKTAVIRELRQVGPDVLHMSIEVPGCGSEAFLPGQYLNVILEDGATRSFSMASAPGGEVLDFYLRRFEGGRFTGQTVARLTAGDSLEVEVPLGSFLYRPEDDRPIVMVGTGTGISPLKAIIESLLRDGFHPPIDLYWGARTEEDLFVNTELAEVASRSDFFRYVPVLSRAPGGWTGRRGYVQDAVIADAPDLSEHAIYLCGSPTMIAAAKHAFLARGASLPHLYSEGFTLSASELDTARARQVIGQGEDTQI